MSCAASPNAARWRRCSSPDCPARVPAVLGRALSSRRDFAGAARPLSGSTYGGGLAARHALAKDVTKDSNALDYPGPPRVYPMLPAGADYRFYKVGEDGHVFGLRVSGHSTTTPPQLPAQPRNANWVKTLRDHSGCDIMRRYSASGVCLDQRYPGGLHHPPTPRSRTDSLGPTS